MAKLSKSKIKPTRPKGFLAGSEAAAKALDAAEGTIWKWLNQALDDGMAGKLPENYGEEFMKLLREVEDAARVQAGEWIKEAMMPIPPANEGQKQS